MDYLIGFLLFQVLLISLGLASMLIGRYLFRQTIAQSTFDTVYLYSAAGLTGVVILGLLANTIVGLGLVFSYAFYAVIFAGSVAALWLFRPKLTSEFVMSFLLMLLLFGFISPVELRRNATVSFGANGDYHNHEKETRLINATSTSVDKESLGTHYQLIHRRVGAGYRYPPGAHYLLIFGRNFVNFFVAFPHFTPLHKYFFVYSMLLALILVRKKYPTIQFGWLAVVLCFSFPLLHVMVGMDFVSQEVSLWLIMLLIFLPVIDQQLKWLPWIIFTLGIVYYHSLLLMTPYLFLYLFRLVRRKSWRTLGLLLAVAAFILLYFAPNMMDISREYGHVLTRGFWVKNLEGSHILGLLPYQMNNAYNNPNLLALVTQQLRPQLTIALLLALCVGLITHIITRQHNHGKRIWIMVLLGFELLFILIGINFGWQYISFKVSSMASIILLPVIVMILDQKKLLMQVVMIVTIFYLAHLYLQLSWYENNNWLRESNSSLYYSPNFQMIVKDLDRTAVIHRNVYFMSLLADEALYEQFYTNEINNNTLINIIPSGSMRDICTLTSINKEKVTSVYVEEGACTNGVYLENWQFSNAFNGKIELYKP